MSSVSRLARTLAHDLRPHGVTALAISPGFTRTEAILAALGDALPPGTDSVEFPGLAVRALLQDPHVARHAGRPSRSPNSPVATASTTSTQMQRSRPRTSRQPSAHRETR